MSCSHCGASFTPRHFNETFCGSGCRIAARRESKAKYKKTPKGRNTELRWRRSESKRATDRRYVRSPRGRATAAARMRRLVATNPYYSERKRLHETAGYRRLREELIATIGACQACGATTRLTLDHVKPLSRGGVHSRENVQLLCVSCNSRKRQSEVRYELP